MKLVYPAAFFLILITSSCRKQPHVDQLGYFFSCTDAANADSVSIRNGLSGRWRWTKQQCFMRPYKTADLPVEVVFDTAGNYFINEGDVIKSGTWQLQREGGSYFGLVTTPGNLWFHGRIFFCGNEVLFNNSYIDGWDNVFVRK